MLSAVHESKLFHVALFSQLHGNRINVCRIKKKIYPHIAQTQPHYSFILWFNWCISLFFFFCMHLLYCPTVVAQAYKVDVEVLAASRGCTAILRCVVPTFVKELVRVVSWVQEPAFYIYPSLQGGKYLHLCNQFSPYFFFYIHLPLHMGDARAEM